MRKKPGQTRQARESGRAGFSRRRYRIPLSALLVFVVGYLGLMAVLFLTVSLVFKETLNAWTASATGSVLRALGSDVTVQGPFVISRVHTFEVITECTALFPSVIFLAAVLAYPCSWRRKLVGVGIGIPLLLAINLVRLVSLYYLGIWLPGSVEMLHLIVWQSLMVLFTILLWLGWARYVVYRGDPRHA